MAAARLGMVQEWEGIGHRFAAEDSFQDTLPATSSFVAVSGAGQLDNFPFSTSPTWSSPAQAQRPPTGSPQALDYTDGLLGQPWRSPEAFQPFSLTQQRSSPSRGPALQSPSQVAALDLAVGPHYGATYPGGAGAAAAAAAMEAMRHSMAALQASPSFDSGAMQRSRRHWNSPPPVPEEGEGATAWQRQAAADADAAAAAAQGRPQHAVTTIHGSPSGQRQQQQMQQQGPPGPYDPQSPTAAAPSRHAWTEAGPNMPPGGAVHGVASPPPMYGSDSPWWAHAGPRQMPVQVVEDQLRGSPITPPSAGMPAALMGGSSGSQGGGSSGGADPSLASKMQAHIRGLEAKTMELQKRLAQSQAELADAQRLKVVTEAAQHDALDKVQEAERQAKTKEGLLETARRANDVMATELRSTQEELAGARDQLAGLKDEAVTWQGQCVELQKELEATHRKLSVVGEEERRLSAEAAALRREVQALNDAIIKGRIEANELRERLQQASQDAAKHAAAAHMMASRAEVEHESSYQHTASLRMRMTELESRNSQLTYDLASSKDDASRLRQELASLKTMLALRPAGLPSDLDAYHRHNGTLSQAWLSAGALPPPAVAAPPPAAAASASPTALPSTSTSFYRPPDTAQLPSSSAAGVGGGGGPTSAYGPGPSGGDGMRSYRPDPPPLPSTSALAGAGGSAPGRDYGGYGHGGAGAGGGGPSALQDRGIAFSQLDPDSFRAMVKAEAARAAAAAEAEARAREPLSLGSLYPSGAGSAARGGAGAAAAGGGGGGGGGHGGWPAGSYDPVELAGGPPRAPSWAAGADVRQSQQFEGLGSHAAQPRGGPHGHGPLGGPPAGAGAPRTSPPPPYATNVVDGGYAYRKAPNAVGTDVPFGTEQTAREQLARSKALEDQLMALCSEKGHLEAEFAKMPLGAGRSLKERQRKAVVEQRLDLLNKEISSVRMQLKRIHAK